MPDAARLIGLLDLTILGASDTAADVEALVARAIAPLPGRPEIHCAAVCVWPNFAAVAARALAGSHVRLACVAGGFPFSQAPLAVKTTEVRAAVEAGATEIDVAINRGLFLGGQLAAVEDEIAAMKTACGTAHLKVILETCELPDQASIRAACQLAIRGGADFLKTSTGKGIHGATPADTRILLEEALACRSRAIGVKTAGGIRTFAEAAAYHDLAAGFFGVVTPDHFRIGASTLLQELVTRL